MALGCGRWREDCNLGVLVALGNLVLPVAAKIDVVVADEIVVIDDCVKRVERIVRILKLLFGDAIAAEDALAIAFAV